MRKSFVATLILAVALTTMAACGGDSTAPAGGGGGGGDGDLLAQIKERGTLVAWTDPAYAPQSEQNEQGEYEGYDIDVTEEIAKRLGVEVEYVTPSFNALTAGSWGGRFDIGVGSVTITAPRLKVLLFTEPYRFEVAAIAVHEDNTDIQDLETDLDGKTIGSCQPCSYELYMNKTLELPGQTFDFVIDDATVKTYDTDTTAITDLAIGDGVRLDAVMSSLFTFEQAIDDGQPIKIVGDPLFSEPIGVVIDKNSPADSTSFYEEVNGIIQDMHADGTLTEFSKNWYDGTDLTKKV